MIRTEIRIIINYFFCVGALHIVVRVILRATSATYLTTIMSRRQQVPTDIERLIQDYYGAFPQEGEWPIGNVEELTDLAFSAPNNYLPSMRPALNPKFESPGFKVGPRGYYWNKTRGQWIKRHVYRPGSFVPARVYGTSKKPVNK